MFLSDGTMRWGELRRAVDGISEKMLAQTLRTLETDGLVLREVTGLRAAPRRLLPDAARHRPRGPAHAAHAVDPGQRGRHRRIVIIPRGADTHFVTEQTPIGLNSGL